MSYKSLEMWKEANELCLKIYSLTNSFPRHEMYNITSQLRRAALSVPTNIVEGYGRLYNKEFYQFLSYARGSAMEVEYLLYVSNQLTYIKQEDYFILNDQCNKIIRMISNFMTKINRQ